MNDAASQFRDAMQSAGLEPPEVIDADKLHRFPGIGKRNGNTAGWCKLFPDGLGGCFGDWSSGFSENWQVKRDQPFTLMERAAFKRHVAEAQAQAEAERKAKQTEAATKAMTLWNAAAIAPDDHAYLIRKGIKASGVRLFKDALLIPVRADGALHSLQFITPEGDKRFLTGGRVAGCYFSIGNPRDAAALCIAEGYATGATIHEATGYPVAVAFNAGNLRAVAKAMREKFPHLPLILCADDDRQTEGNPGLTQATEAAHAVGGSLATPSFGDDRPEGVTDFNDMATLCGMAAVARAVTTTADIGALPTIEALQTTQAVATEGPQPPPSPIDTATIHRLAALAPLEYDRVRKTEAETLGVRPGTLDKQVATLRKNETHTGLNFDDIEPWPHPIAPSQLLTELSTTVQRFIVCQPETADTVALWTAMTWFIDVVQVAPLAIITAPEKRCGKSQLLFLLGRLCYRPLTASNISPAALFRAIDAWKPTLLVDEADSFMRENEELRGLLNCGHTRDSAYIVRVVGENFTPTKFNVWGAKALAGIGHMADTLMDRAVVLELRRKLPHENVDRLRHAESHLFENLASMLARFAEDYRDTVRSARPELPASLNDRAQDNWEPLLAIAEAAGGVWPDLARKAALKLAGADGATLSIGTELLTDIQEVLDRKRVDRITTADLLTTLCDDDEKPWATYNRGKPMTPRQLARKLDGFGVKSKNLKIGYGDVKKGFEREQFAEAFSRYLSATPPPENIRYPLPSNSGAASEVADRNEVAATSNPSATLNPMWHKESSGVADKSLETENDNIGRVEVEI